jgi:hypothetical protein
MKLPLPRPSRILEQPDRSDLVPGNARAVGWFWLAAVPVGFVTGVIEFIGALQGGGLSIALPVGVGLSGWAIGRGLLRGNRRAWLWARRLAALATLGAILVVAIVLFADPESVTLEFPWGTHEAAKWESLLFLGLVAGVGAWQFLALNGTAARTAYDSHS